MGRRLVDVGLPRKALELVRPCKPAMIVHEFRTLRASLLAGSKGFFVRVRNEVILLAMLCKKVFEGIFVTIGIIRKFDPA